MRLQDLQVSGPIATAAGMFGVWRASAFTHVNELDAWEDDVADDAALAAWVSRGAFVPINIGSDGAYQIEVRGAGLNQRELAYRLVSSQPYRLVSDGKLEVGGLEGVGDYTGAPTLSIGLDEGEYSVVVHLLDWKAEPGSVDSDGSPTDNALPDFLVELGPATAEGGYRQAIETFDRP